MESRKVRNIGRDPNVTVLFDVTAPALIGVVVYGTADLEHTDVLSRRTAILSRAMPDDVAAAFAQRLADAYHSVVIRVRPQRIVSFDYRKGFPA